MLMRRRGGCSVCVLGLRLRLLRLRLRLSLSDSFLMLSSLHVFQHRGEACAEPAVAQVAVESFVDDVLRGLLRLAQSLRVEAVAPAAAVLLHAAECDAAVAPAAPSLALQLCDV